jgi:hypothetical protein
MNIVVKTTLKLFFIFNLSPLAASAAFTSFTTSSENAAIIPTSAQACTPVDFRNTFPMAIRNQGQLAWCFAHASADYLQYTYQIPEQISAADIAINYSQSNLSKLIHFFQSIASKKSRETPAQTGIAKFAIEKIIPQGYCPETNFPSDEWIKTLPDQSQQKIEILAAILDVWQLQKQVQSGAFTAASDLPYFYSFPQINRQQFFEILQTSSHRHLLENLRVSACTSSRKPFPGNSFSAKFHFRSRHIFQEINSSFDQHQPVAIDFFNATYFNLDDFAKKGLHTVLLYGRKYDPAIQQCVYLMKNSHGTDCTPYDPRLHCEAGYLWFPEDALFHSMLSELSFQRN